MKTKQIKAAAAYSGHTLAELARAVELSPQGLQQKLQRETLKDEELKKLAELMGAEYICCFRFPDGVEI